METALQPIHTPTPYKRKYEPELAHPNDCAAFRRNTLRYCFNKEYEIQHNAREKMLSGQSTAMEYSTEMAFSRYRLEKFRQLVTQYLKPEDRQELAQEVK